MDQGDLQVMTLPLYSALSAFVLTLCLIYLFRKIAYRIDLVDKPGGRKHHTEAIPVVGGLAMFLGFTFSALTLNQPWVTFSGLWASSALLVVVGVLDDRYGLSTRSRFAAQALATLLMIFYGQVCLTDLGDLWGYGNVTLGHGAVFFTVFCVIGIINAVNMADGLDGLAGGLSLIAAVWLTIVALLSGAHMESASYLILLTAAIAGFLFHNLRHPWRARATVFMGDAGSMMLGFVLTWFFISLSQGAQPAMTPITAVWILALPLLDTVCIMLRRIFKGRSPFCADREHLHHSLLLAGYSDAQTVTIMLITSATLGAIGVLGWLWGVPEYVMSYAFIALFALYLLAMSYAWKLMKALKRLHTAGPETLPSRKSL